MSSPASPRPGLRRLFPDPEPTVDPADAYRRLSRVGPHRPAVRMNMITSADGAASLQERTAGLGGIADTHRVRRTALVGRRDPCRRRHPANRELRPGPPRLRGPDPPRGLGSGPVPAIAVLTRSCRLDWQAPFFTQAEQRPLVLTTDSADASGRARAATVADVVVAGHTSVDLPLALQDLAERGVDNVLAEGGPRVSAQLAAAGLLDELCLTVAPLLVAGAATRILNGPELDHPVALELTQALESDGYLFLQYRRYARPTA